LRAEGAQESLSAFICVHLWFQFLLSFSVNLCASVSLWFKACPRPALCAEPGAASSVEPPYSQPAA